jgi:hypothetical protein
MDSHPTGRQLAVPEASPPSTPRGMDPFLGPQHHCEQTLAIASLLRNGALARSANHYSFSRQHIVVGDAVHVQHMMFRDAFRPNGALSKSVGVMEGTPAQLTRTIQRTLMIARKSSTRI